MQVKVEKKEKTEVKIEITVEAEEFIKATQKVYSKNAKYFNIPGFRKGKAPQAVVEKYYGNEIFYEDAFNDVFTEFYPKAIEEKSLDVVSQPTVDVTQMEKGKDLIFTATVETKPEVKLGKYKGVEIEKVEYPVTDNDVEEELKKVQDTNSRLVNVTDRAVENGDTTVIDYEGSVDGIPFEGGKDENHELVIGSNTFIPGFEDQVIGMKIDEIKEINVKFPDDYNAEDLKGKDAVFKVTLHEIKVKELPELDDDFAKDVSEFDTLDEYKANIKFKKEEEADSKATEEMQNNILKVISDSSEVEITDPMVDLELTNMINDMDQRLRYQGFTLDQYLQMVNKTKEDFKNENRDVAHDSLKSRWVLEAVTKDLKIEADETELNNKVDEYSKMYGMTVDEFKSNDELMDTLKITIENDKTLKYLLDNAKLVKSKKDTTKKSDTKKDDSKKNEDKNLKKSSTVKKETSTAKKSSTNKKETSTAKKATKSNQNKSKTSPNKKD